MPTSCFMYMYISMYVYFGFLKHFNNIIYLCIYKLQNLESKILFVSNSHRVPTERGNGTVDVHNTVLTATLH